MSNGPEPGSTDYLAPRRCLRDPIPSLFAAAEVLSRAVDAHLAGDRQLAGALIATTNTVEIRDYIESLWGSKLRNPDQVHYLRRRKVQALPEIQSKAKDRMPNPSEKRVLIERDGYRCRYCNLPVVPAEVRGELHLCYPQELPWATSGKGMNLRQHAAFQALWLQYEHVVPACYGGDSSLDNMVVSCAGCNFGKGNSHLAELGLMDPRDRAPKASDWIGLTHIGNRLDT